MTILAKILKKTPRVAPERAVYEAIVAAARRPVLYADFAVPDTVAGRFDMIVLHAFLVLERVKESEPVFAQALTDELFRDMDRSLREMGVGDLSVGKKVRGLAEAYAGRLRAYARTIADCEKFTKALGRNVWAETGGGHPDELAAYALALRAKLILQSPGTVAAGRVELTT